MSQTHPFSSFDTTPFFTQVWSNTEEPNYIIVGGHGFCGASYDFENFAERVLTSLPHTTVYAANLRGMGLDPVLSRRGDIESHDYWMRDLHTLTRQLRAQHPKSKIIWCAESLGAMIAVHSFVSAASFEMRCDALALLSPVVAIGKQVAGWKIALAKCVARILPHYRLNLKYFTGEQQVKVTQGAEDHTEQSTTNSWHVENFTLRQLHAIAILIEQMPTFAASLDCPVLVLNGGNDYFTPASTLESWLTHLPHSSQLRHHFLPEAYHLLLYDAQSEEVFDSFSNWVQSLEFD